MTQLLLDMPTTVDHVCVTHAVLPDMSLACGDDLLAVRGGCRAGTHFMYGANWSGVTCPWCHSLGRAWFGRAAKSMQARQS